MHSRTVRLIAATALSIACVPTAFAQTTRSADLVKQLMNTLSAQKLDALAVRDPEQPTNAIAVLAFPNSQLLAVAGPYPDQASLDSLLSSGMYRDVYAALQQPTVASGRLFIQDMGCDGLGTAESIDIVYENAQTQTILDGNWKKQGLSQGTYDERAKAAEARYARMLAALIAAAQKTQR